MKPLAREAFDLPMSTRSDRPSWVPNRDDADHGVAIYLAVVSALVFSVGTAIWLSYV